MEQINGCFTNGAPSPAELWFVCHHGVAVDRVVLGSFYTRMPAEMEDNHGASVRDKLVVEKKKLDDLYEHMKGRFEDAFILQRVRAEELFSTQPVKVGNLVRSELLRRGKLDPFWSKEIKRVVKVGGNIVFLEGDDKGYHARQVKVVPATKAPSETEAPDPEVEEAADSAESQSTSDSNLKPNGNHAEQATARLYRPSNFSEEDHRSSPAETEEPVVVPTAALSRKRRKSVVDFLQYSRPEKRQVPLSFKAREALEEGWRHGKWIRL
jgi:hypothetical protein